MLYDSSFKPRFLFLHLDAYMFIEGWIRPKSLKHNFFLYKNLIYKPNVVFVFIVEIFYLFFGMK